MPATALGFQLKVIGSKFILNWRENIIMMDSVFFQICILHNFPAAHAYPGRRHGAYRANYPDFPFGYYILRIKRGWVCMGFYYVFWHNYSLFFLDRVGWDFLHCISQSGPFYISAFDILCQIKISLSYFADGRQKSVFGNF